MSRGDDLTESFSDPAMGLPIEQGLLLDEACDAFEGKWRAGGRPDILAAVMELPGSLRAVALSELVQLDVYYRRERGQTPATADYASYFPGLVPPWLARLVEEPNAAADPNARTAARMPATEAPPTIEGERLAGYQVFGEIARGAMGVVYKARHIALNRPAAIKMIIGGRYHDPVARVRFAIEAEAVAALDHPNVVRVHEFGVHEGLPFFAMEYVGGGSLAEKLARDGKPSPRAAAGLVLKLADGVAAAHAKGVVHRTSPANVLPSPGRRAEGGRLDSLSQGLDLTVAGAAGWHAQLHEPGAGGGPGAGRRDALGRVLAGGHPVRTAHWPTAVQGRLPVEHAPTGPDPGPRAPAGPQPGGPP